MNAFVRFMDDLRWMGGVAEAAADDPEDEARRDAAGEYDATDRGMTPWCVLLAALYGPPLLVGAVAGYLVRCWMGG